MSEQSREALWPVMLDMDQDEVELVIERSTIQEGRTFSAHAMEELHDQLIVFIGTRIMRRWNATGEPPTGLRVEMKVTAS